MTVATFEPEAVVATGNCAAGHIANQRLEPDSYQLTHALAAGVAHTMPSERTA